MKMHAYALHALKLSLITVVFFGGPASSQTTVYRGVDKDGGVTYSDKPTPGSTKVEVAPVQAVSPQPAASKAPGGNVQAQPPAAAPVYNEFLLVSPKPDQAIRSNSGEVTIGLKIDPELRDGDRIRVLIDAKSSGEPSRNTVQTLTNVDRGTHRLRAEVVDRDDKVLVSAGPVTFHLLRVAAKRRQPKGAN